MKTKDAAAEVGGRPHELLREDPFLARPIVAAQVADSEYRA